MLNLSVFALLVASVSAISFSANSRAGQKLLKNSELVEGRRLNNNDNDFNIENIIGQFHLRYTGCYNVLQLSGEGGGGGGGGDGGGSGIQNGAVVVYELAESCRGSKYIGRYATNMMQFVDSYTESILEEQEWRCENFRESECAYCENYDDGEACETSCFAGAEDSDGNNMTACIQMQEQEGQGGQEGQEEFEIQRYLECAEMGQNNNGENNQNNWNGGDSNGPYNWDGGYRVGAYCADDGKSINLGVFYDEDCSLRAPNSVYSKLNYGQSLPFSSESIVPSSTCLSCIDQEKQAENNNDRDNNQNGNANENNWYNMEPREFCVQAYTDSTKCENENNGFIYYTQDSGCYFINKYLPNLPSKSAARIAGGAKASLVFAWVFAISTLLFGSYAYFLYRKIKRGGAGLISQQGGALA